MSGSTKTLICLMYTDWIFSITAMGNNCYKFLKEIAQVKDITLCIQEFSCLFEYIGVEEIKILNDNSIIHSDKELLQKCLQYKGDFYGR